MTDDDRLIVMGRISDQVKLSNGRFMDVSVVETVARRQHPYIREICLWEEDGCITGVAYGGKKPALDFYLDGCRVIIRFVTKPFLDIRAGTLTLKGEPSRGTIRAMFSGKKKLK